MKIPFLIIILISIYFCTSSVYESKDQVHELGIKDLLPRDDEVNGWSPEGETEYAEGEDLFLLIDGGAQIYHEYGFKKAAYQRYSDKNGKSINLELYEMSSQEAAYGIYTFRRGDEGNPVDVGHEGWLESYYLNFWQGNFLVTIVGLDTDITILDGLKRIARAVDSKLTFASEHPRITSYLPKENLKINGIAYLRGNLALFDQYLFDEDNIFGLGEGVVGKYDDHSIFLFQYGNQEDSKKWYEFAKNRLKHSKRFDNFADKIDQFEVSDHQNNRLSIKHHHRWIIIILGNIDINANRILNSLEEILIQ